MRHEQPMRQNTTVSQTPGLELPIVPFVRQADLAVHRPWHYGELRLLDSLLVYVREGVMHLRLEHAKELLRGTALPIVRIAAYCGFSDAHHLSRCSNERWG